jgi:hypothetical protein
VHRGEDQRRLAEADRGPREGYDAAVTQASKEDLGVSKPSDEAQSGDEQAEHA